MKTTEREYVRENETWSPVNPLALFYRHLFEEELTALFRREGVDLSNKKIVEAGCGYGEKTRFLIELGARPDGIYAFDTDAEVTEKAASTIEGPTFTLTDGTALPYSNDTFDVAILFLYVSVLEPGTTRRLAANEITRVLKPNGFIMWYDTVEKGGGYLWGLEPKEIAGLFPGYEPELRMFGLRYDWTVRTVYKSFEAARLLARSGIAKSHVIGIIKPKF
jgi:SAM-dependent methyltransferase